MISHNEQVALMQTVISIFKSVVPIRTGNLRYNAVKLEDKGNGVWEISIDEKIAPYMPYTNEPWVSPKFNGKKNPNEHWFDDAAGLIAILISQELNGNLSKE